MKLIFYCSLILFVFSTSCGKKNNDWFLVEKIDDRTYIISEPKSSQENSSFLILGDSEAILFDSGTGENKRQSIVQLTDSLTNLPVTLLLSHFHFDHVGNVEGFDRIAMPEIELLKNKLSADSLLVLHKNELLSNDSMTLQISRLLPVGKEIDLGNRKIKLLHTPGHSKESISIIDDENEYVFTGDLVYNGLLLCNDCDAYRNSINGILKNSNPNYRVFGSHGRPEVSYKRLSQINKAIESYLVGDYPHESVRKINFFGITKDVYEFEDVSFIVGYSDVFNHD